MATARKKINVADLRRRKGRGSIVAITAYDAATAAFVDRADVDLILVGDSVGTVQLGFGNTIPVTLEMMLHHTAAVARANPRALLVADLPFPGAHQGWPDLLKACSRLMQESRAEAVKLEGGRSVATQVARLVEAGIPVLGHIGLLPQRYHALGGYRRTGQSEDERDRLVDDALALDEAGAFGLVLELVDPEAARLVSGAVSIPVIGIGVGVACDGQILVVNDLAGLNPGRSPGFAKAFASLGEQLTRAVGTYASEVREGKFPS